MKVEMTKDTGLVFITGGSALNKLARMLADNRLFATYIVAVFDNGGSTALLRQYCGIAIGDIRNRLVAIAEHDSPESKVLADLFSLRIHGNKPQRLMRAAVEDIASGRSESLADLPQDVRDEISKALMTLLAGLPETFDWRDGAIGNFILVGRYLQDKDWEATLKWAHRIVGACGLVLPTTIESAHLGAHLKNGSYIVGQNRLTDESRPIRSPIERILLLPSDTAFAKTKQVSIYPPARNQLEKASAIVYSWGSFYTSVLSGFLVGGLPETILASGSPKVLLLNPLKDAETLGKTPVDLVEDLARYARSRAGDTTGKIITHVLALRSTSPSPSQFYSVEYRAPIERLGVNVIEVECDETPNLEQLETIMRHLLELAHWDLKNEVK
ncbi:MAG TPA: 2-phospho-L-lactate transferase CofD family protein [Blastocatellia bacterium]|nr:2-phospho-L-lactate transferase CofD family protein [Blastocatellia bacterium]